jgi:hypothetical protein
MTIYTSHSCPSDGKTIARDMSVVRIAECFKEYIITANHPNTRMLSETILGYWRHKYVTHPDQSPRREGKDVGSMNLTLRCDADDKDVLEDWPRLQHIQRDTEYTGKEAIWRLFSVARNSGL